MSQKIVPVTLVTHFKTGFLVLVFFTLITGFLYPFLMTGLAQALFPSKADGSPLVKNQTVVGFELIGQSFDDPKYFWGRPSATLPYPYNALSSMGSNLSPTNVDFINAVKKRIEMLHKVDPQNDAPIPIELVTASGSGLDPHISVNAAFYQIPRIARVRHLTQDFVKNLVTPFIEKRQFGILGEPRINVLKLNLALDTYETTP